MARTQKKQSRVFGVADLLKWMSDETPLAEPERPDYLVSDGDNPPDVQEQADHARKERKPREPREPRQKRERPERPVEDHPPVTQGTPIRPKGTDARPATPNAASVQVPNVPIGHRVPDKTERINVKRPPMRGDAVMCDGQMWTWRDLYLVYEQSEQEKKHKVGSHPVDYCLLAPWPDPGWKATLIKPLLSQVERIVSWKEGALL